MYLSSDTRKFLINVTLVVALVTVALPLCAMLGCDMAMGTMMPFNHHGGPTIGALCAGMWTTSVGQIGIVPPNVFAALVAMLAVLGFAGFLQPMMSTSRSFLVAEANAPPAPLSPRGERFLV